MRKLTHEELVTLRLSTDEAKSSPRFPITLVLEDIRSLYNVGSIFRSADAFRAEQLVLTGYTPQPPRKEITKTALGAETSVPWLYSENITQALTQLRDAGVRVFALEIADKARSLNDLTHMLAGDNARVALVLGNELTGVSATAMGLCEGAVEIPMFGTKHSLNVAVAAGIVLHTLVSSLADPTRAS